MDEDKLDELAVSIRAIGLQQPMIVARLGERYEVIAGHRRRLACARAGLAAAPCIVYPDKTAALESVKYAENRFREDLNPADEAIWFSELLERDCGGDIEKLAGLVGEKLSYINNRLLLFGGDPDVFQALRDGKIKIGVAHEINKCPDPEYRRYYLEHAVRGGATVAVVNGWITEWKNMYAERAPVQAGEPSTAPSVVIPIYDPMACYVCKKSDPRFIPNTIYVHAHCQLAILEPLIETVNGTHGENN